MNSTFCYADLPQLIQKFVMEKYFIFLSFSLLFSLETNSNNVTFSIYVFCCM